MKQYDSYKDSGVQWIGKIPSHWNVGNLLYFLRSKICDGPHETPNLVDDGVPFISIDSLNDTCRIDLDVVKKYISEEDYQRYYQKANLEEGDVLFTKAATIGKTAIVGKEKFMVWSPLAILKPNYNLICSKFLYYIVGCSKAVEETILMGNVNTQVNLGMRDLEKLRIACPSISEQNHIISFLDKKCEEIDKAIATQQKRIDLLGELHQNIITHAVTHGINPDAPLKKSGVECIGKVPEHWEVKRIKHVITLLTDYDANGSFADIAKNCNVNIGEPYAWMVRATDLENKRYGIVDGNNYCDLATYNYLSKTSLKADDILIAKRGDIGKSYLVPQCDDPMTLAPNTYLLLTNKRIINNRYFYYYLQSKGGVENLKILNKSTTLGALYKDDVKAMQLPVPPISEQQEIVSYIETQTARLDKAIEKANRQIELLQELKQSTITEVVTGKRKVC